MTRIYWQNKDGDKIRIDCLSTEYLLNIKKWIEKRAEKGVVIEIGRGFDADDTDFETLYGNDVKNMYHYRAICAEIKRR